jgi:ankyrin repeat protein
MSSNELLDALESIIQSLEDFKAIKALCSKSETRPESERVKLLKAIILSNPTVVRERDANGRTLLHYAALYSSVDFIKELVESDGGRECVEKINSDGWLPFHIACIFGNVEVAKYLILLYPESINVRDNDGYSALHLVVVSRDFTKRYFTEEDSEELTRFLILHDQGALAMPNHFGGLPLHEACDAKHQNLSVVKLLYDANPKAMEIRNNDGDTPLDIARQGNQTEFAAFLQLQLELQHQARDIVQPDQNGQLPIHRVLKTPEPSLGTIKLMAADNPASLAAADIRGFIPLHIACKFGHLDIVKYLIEAKEDSLQATTVRGYPPLHLACLSGKCHVVNYILERSDHGVSSPIHGRLPIELLLSESANCDRSSLEYVDAVRRLLRANPEAISKFSVAQEEHASPISWNLLFVLFVYVIILLMCWLK